MLDGARLPVQIDIGFGDAVVPGPQEASYPVILGDMPSPQLRVYPRYTVVAEKLEAITSLGMINTRMKDYFDLWILARQCDFDGDVLGKAVRATFERRGTPIPPSIPFGLTEAFATDEKKVQQWTAFQRKNALDAPSLSVVIQELEKFLWPVLMSVPGEKLKGHLWSPGVGWHIP